MHKKSLILEISYKKNVFQEAEWSSKVHPHTFEPFEQFVGPTHDLPEDSEPIDFFNLFFDDEFYNVLVTETNRYAKDKGSKFQTTVDEMRVYIGKSHFLL